MHGCAVEYRESGGGFCCLTDERGGTNVRTVFAAGDVTGFLGVEPSFENGRAVGACP
jgi:thioredoxin reductase